jgi:sulfur-oxidizing protein SoxZ
MTDMMKIRARLQDGVTEVRILMNHPMETGHRKNDSGDLIPAHFIQMVSVTVNRKTVLEAEWGTGISKDPYLTMRLRNTSLGDKISVTWHDNRGESNFIEATVEGA